MPSLDQHPTVLHHRAHAAAIPPAPATLDAGGLRQLCLDAGADDVGFVEVGRAELAAEREHILAAFPRTKTLVSLVCRMNRGPIRSPARSVANLEFHHFKYDGFRRPGDLHIHFFGTGTLSIADGIETKDGDEFEISAPAFGAPLRNKLKAVRARYKPDAVKVL